MNKKRLKICICCRVSKAKIYLYHTTKITLKSERYTQRENYKKKCTGCTVSKAKFYLYHSTKIANARPPLEVSSEYNSVQRQWFMDGFTNFL